jgi:hypothetical protein
MSEVKTCVSCKHMGDQPPEPYMPHGNPHGFQQQVNRGPECRSQRAVTRDMVYGKAFCINERNSAKGCGKQGKLWEPKSDAK